MALTWTKTINIGPGDRVVVQGLLRSDGHWWMWEVSDHREYLEETRGDLEARLLDPSLSINDGGEEEFTRFFEEERKRRGLVYMNDVDVFEGLKGTTL